MLHATVSWRPTILNDGMWWSDDFLTFSSDSGTIEKGDGCAFRLSFASGA